MALALLMTTAGGAVVNANIDQSLESPNGFASRGGENGVLLKINEQTESLNKGVENVEPINKYGSQMDQSSWFGSFWGGVKTFWKKLCCAVGLPWCKVK